MGIAAGFGAIACAASPISDDCKQAFQDFKLQYKKIYTTAEEEAKRLLIFASNYAVIQAHNLLNHSYTLGVNELADMTPEEFRSTRLGFSLPANGSQWKGLNY